MIRMWRSVLACVCALSLLFVPSASADMRGIDVSNWQCDIDTYALDADFIVAGATWGIGGFNNTCLTNGVNQAANYQLGRATDSGKSIGVYHYAMGYDANAEADFFINNVRGMLVTRCLFWTGNLRITRSLVMARGLKRGYGMCMTALGYGRLSMFRRPHWGSLRLSCGSIVVCGLHSMRRRT